MYMNTPGVIDGSMAPLSRLRTQLVGTPPGFVTVWRIWSKQFLFPILGFKRHLLERHLYMFRLVVLLVHICDCYGLPCFAHNKTGASSFIQGLSRQTEIRHSNVSRVARSFWYDFDLLGIRPCCNGSNTMRLLNVYGGKGTTTLASTTCRARSANILAITPGKDSSGLGLYSVLATVGGMGKPDSFTGDEMLAEQGNCWQ